MRLRNYYRNFRSVNGLLAAALGSLPWLSALVSTFANRSSDFFPPLGGVSLVGVARTVSLGICGAATLAVYWFGKSEQGRSDKGLAHFVAMLVLITLLSFAIYFALYSRFVCYAPARSGPLPVAIGITLSEAGQKTFDSCRERTPECLLSWEPSDKGAWIFWTPWSVLLVRFGMFFFYTLLLSAVVALSSIPAIIKTLEETPSLRVPKEPKGASTPDPASKRAIRKKI